MEWGLALLFVIQNILEAIFAGVMVWVFKDDYCNQDLWVWYIVSLAAAGVTLMYYIVYLFWACKPTPQHTYTAAELAGAGVWTPPPKSPSSGYTTVTMGLVPFIALFWLVWSIVGLVWAALSGDCPETLVVLTYLFTCSFLGLVGLFCCAGLCAMFIFCK